MTEKKLNEVGTTGYVATGLESQAGVPFDKGAIFKAGFTPIDGFRLFNLLSEMKDESAMEYIRDNRIADSCVCVIDAENKGKGEPYALKEREKLRN